MDKSAVIEIVRNLVTVVQALSGYPVPEHLPEVQQAPQRIPIGRFSLSCPDE